MPDDSAENDVLRIRVQQQAAVAELGLRALATSDLDALLVDACDLIAGHLDVDLVKVLQRLPGSDELFLRAGIGWRHGLVGTAIVPGGEASAGGYAVTLGKPLIIHDLRGHTPMRSALLEEHGVVSGISVVLNGPRKPFGALGAYTRRARAFTEDDANFLQAVANVLAAAIASHGHATQRDLLAEASQLLNSSLDYEQTLRTLAALLVRRLGDWCAVHVVDEDGSIREIEVAHRDPQLIERVQRFRTRYAAAPTTGRGVRWVIESGRPEVYATVPADIREQVGGGTEYGELLDILQIRSAMLLPMVARGRTVGVIQLVSSRPQRRYGYDDARLGMELATRAALAVDNARLYRRAQETASLRESFLASVSHELRTPLTSVLGFAHRLSRRADRLEPDIRADVEILTAEAQRMRTVIDTFTDLADLESGRVESTSEPVELRRLLEEEARALRRRFPSVRIDEHYPPDSCILLTDPDRVHHVVSNLLRNAAKHGGSPAHITLTLEANDSHALIVVRDRGPGIPPEMHEQIFERFIRGPSVGANAREPGMGLGLYLARLIALRLGGRLTVGTPEDGGAEFTFALPQRQPVQDTDGTDALEAAGDAERDARGA